jgi:hypothetical protein
MVALERIETKLVLEAHYDNRKSQRIQTAIHELQVVNKFRELAALLSGDLLKSPSHTISDRHLCSP